MNRLDDPGHKRALLGASTTVGIQARRHAALAHLEVLGADDVDGLLFEDVLSKVLRKTCGNETVHCQR